MSQDTRRLGQTVEAISQRIPVIVREEIELAKAEVTQKATKVGKGAVIAAAAGVFVVAAAVMILFGLAILISWAIGGAPFWGYFIMAALLLLLALIVGLAALKAFKSGGPPAPLMAIDEAKALRDTVTSSDRKDAVR